MKRVTGIGGIFFKAQDPEKMYAWYERHLGIPRGDHGTMFHWRDAQNPEKEGMTVWAMFPESTGYFKPSEAPFMLNYIVDDMDAVLEALRAEGVTIEKQEDHDYGRFAWIIDPEGNKLELWQPKKN